MRPVLLALVVFCVATSLWFGCGRTKPVAGNPHDAATIIGTPTESVCPAIQTLTYANFGRGFLDTYCQSCHASTVTGAARNGAPADHVFDQIEDIRLLAEHVDELAAAGPAAINTAMPPKEPRPTEAARRQLGEWLACGAP